MLFRHFASGLLIAVSAVAVTSGCANKVQTEYFEPSGDANIISVPATGPRNVASVTYGPSASMSVRASVVQGVATVNIVLALRPGADAVKFTGRRVVFEVGGTRDEREAMWDVSLLDNSRPRTERVAFDADLKPPNIAAAAPSAAAATPPGAATPQTGVTTLGIYQSTVVVPLAFQAAKEFRLTVPAVAGGRPIVLNFVRRNAG